MLSTENTGALPRRAFYCMYLHVFSMLNKSVSFRCYIKCCVQETAGVGAHDLHSKLADQRVSIVRRVSLQLMLTWVVRIKVNYHHVPGSLGPVFMFQLKNQECCNDQQIQTMGQQMYKLYQQAHAVCELYQQVQTVGQ